MGGETVAQASRLSAHRLRALATDVGALGVLQVLMRLQGLVLLPIIARFLGAAGYGIWTQFFVAGELLGTLVSFALDDPLIRFVAGARTREAQREHYYSMLTMVVGANIAAGAALAAFPEFFARLIFGSAEYAPFVLLLSPYLVMEAFDEIALNMMRALQRLQLYAALEASQAIVRVAAVGIALYIWQDVLAAVAVYMGVQLLWLAAELLINYRLVGFAIPTFRHVRESLAYGLPLIPTRYANVVLSYSDRLVITHFFGAAAVGVYAAAYDMARLLAHVLLPVRLAIAPITARLWDEGRQVEAAGLLSQSMRYAFVLGVPAAVGLSVLAPHFLAVVASAEFAAASRQIAPLVALGIFLNGVAAVFSLLLRLHKDTRSVALAIGVSAAVHVALNLVLIPSVGIVGGALATLLGYALELALMYRLAWRLSRFRIPAWPALAAVMASALMLPVIAWIVSGGGWLPILFAIGAGLAVYGVAAFLMGAVTVRDVRLVFGRTQA